MSLDVEVIDLCDSSDESITSNDNGKLGQKASDGHSSASHHLRPRDHKKNRCHDQGEESIISISSGTEGGASNDGHPSTFKDCKPAINNRKRPRRHPRRANGYHLEKGERIVWATDGCARDDARKSHEAIVLHPQPDDPPSAEMVRIRWLTTNAEVWIPAANIGAQICGDDDDEVKVEETGIGGNKQNSAFTSNGFRKLSKRKRVPTKRLIDTITNGPQFQLACEREYASTTSKKRRKTCCTNIESWMNLKPDMLPTNVRSAIAIVHAKMQMKSNNKESRPEESSFKSNGKFEGDWWHTNKELDSKMPDGAKQKMLIDSQGGQSVPFSIVTCDFDDTSVSSTSLVLPESDSSFDLNSMGSDTSGSRHGKLHQRGVTSQVGCHVCDGHAHYCKGLDKLLGDRKAVDADEKYCLDFVTRFKVLLQGLEDDGCDKDSIFYHTCERSETLKPILTVVKLIQLFDSVSQTIYQSSRKDMSTSLMQLLFRPWRKNSPKDCGVVIQTLRIATFEIINSRQDFELPTEYRGIDHLIAITFGLQALQTMARNAYYTAKTKFQDIPTATVGFHDQPLESYKACIRRNCQVRDRRPTILCKLCGLRFHKCCLSSRENVDAREEKLCTSCGASTLLLAAAKKNNLSAIYDLVVNKGASPIQPLISETTSSETAIHVAVQNNNYDLASMLLFGSYLLLNCDDSLRGWDLPEIVWGKDSKQKTPFQSGIDVTIRNMDARPPVEILLLLTGRGAQETSEQIKKALETRQGMMLVMNGLHDKQELQKADMSMGLEPVPIPVANSGLPEFMYVARGFESRITAIRWFDCRGIKRNQLRAFDGKCTTDSLKILHRNQHIQPSWRAYCNYLCASRSKQLQSEKCDCQIAENGLHHGLEVFQTPDGRGFGVRTARGVTIKKNEVICHYSGEIISSNEAKRRDQEYYSKSHKGSYILDIDEKGQYCIDATKFRSVSALVNHSCSESNCELFRAFGNHLDSNFPLLGLSAKNDIGELTELQFNYIKGFAGEKPEGLCDECKTVHCLCRQCKKSIHEKM